MQPIQLRTRLDLATMLRLQVPKVWIDPAGVTHACAGAMIHHNVGLIWTLCGRDVPGRQGEHLRRRND